MLSNWLENGEKYIEKCNFYIKYLDKIECYADRPYLVFSELIPETYIYIFLALEWCYYGNKIFRNFARAVLCKLFEEICFSFLNSVNYHSF